MHISSLTGGFKDLCLPCQPLVKILGEKCPKFRATLFVFEKICREILLAPLVLAQVDQMIRGDIFYIFGPQNIFVFVVTLIRPGTES